MDGVWNLLVFAQKIKRIEPMNYGAKKNVGSIKVSRQMTTYPSPKSQLTLERVNEVAF